MDVIKEIQIVLESLDKARQTELTNGVITHIERSVFLFNQARITNDEQYYTDSIYRTNQAYEGILKEAYMVFSGKSVVKKRTVDLENYFEKNNFFNNRVKKSFALYRQEWRNPATHNHNLFFKMDEAFLAVVNVSAFIFVLLNQISEQISYKNTKQLFKNKTNNIKIDSLQKDKITKLIVDELKRFYSLYHQEKEDINTEYQLIGALKGFLENKFSNLEIQSDYYGDMFSIYRPDIAILKDNEIVVLIEVKKEYHKSRLDAGYKQVKSYLYESKLKQGILYFYTSKPNQRYSVINKKIYDMEIITMIPEKDSS